MEHVAHHVATSMLNNPCLRHQMPLKALYGHEDEIRIKTSQVKSMPKKCYGGTGSFTHAPVLP